ncbi:MAG: hypothetical protein SOW32_12865 [Agathobacter sp.]|nr:hypothetical protein [Agathobacter sp.]
MSAQDQTEKVLRQLHVLLSKSEPYNREPTKVIVDKEQMLTLLADLNKCIYGIMDEYELTQRSRDRAEREFRKQGDQIVWDASRKAEDIYAASVMYTDEALNRVWDIMHETSEKVGQLYTDMAEHLKEQERAVKSNQLELKSQLQDLVDTEKYLSLIEQRNRELKKQKEEGKPKERMGVSEKSIYANRQSEIRVNTEYLEKLGYAVDDEVEEETQEQSKVQDTKQNDAADIKINVKLPESDSKAENIENKQDKESKQNKESKKEEEEKLRAELDAEYFEWIDLENPTGDNKPANDLSEGIHKMWKSIKSSKNNK